MVSVFGSSEEAFVFTCLRFMLKGIPISYNHQSEGVWLLLNKAGGKCNLGTEMCCRLDWFVGDLLEGCGTGCRISRTWRLSYWACSNCIGPPGS